ncbi:T9SS C-terminal target domain-containing protein [Rufibacter immobilis]|uniref:T9SS C-terminal target domain-containing protein n=1 Tax=Rufibacter immobilis TaxID=1348778 RepID=A0A3M9MPQ9_9BACT|nr:T9SS type A sorting domain-containing protein [Rufibacter immobilis]RNI27514.1 T9SS C-terminal target domain-containing protein [Rufibacter immobilis]
MATPFPLLLSIHQKTSTKAKSIFTSSQMKPNLYVPSFFTGSSHPNFYRVLNFIGIGLIKNPKRSCLLLTVLFHLLLVAEPAQAQVTGVTYYSQKSGNFNEGAVWGENIAPGSNEYNNNNRGTQITKFVIRSGHTVVLNINFELGNQSNNTSIARQILIEEGAVLKGSSKLTIHNNGSNLINEGEVELGNVVFGRDLSGKAIFINNGFASITSSEQAKNTLIENNGNFTFTNNSVALVNSEIKNLTNGVLTFQNQVHLNEGTVVRNYGNVVMQSTVNEALNLNRGAAYNYGKVTMKGGINFASGNSMNLLHNYGVINTKKIYQNAISTIENWGKVYCKENIENVSSGKIVNHPCAYIEAENFVNKNNQSSLINNGYIKIRNNFIDNEGLVTGNGMFYIMGTKSSRNQGSFATTLQFILTDNELTSYCPTTPSCEKPTVAITGPSEICNISDELITYKVTNPQPNTTYIFTLPEGITLVEGEGTGTITVFAAFEESQLGVPQTITVTGYNNCGSNSASKHVIITECGNANPLPVELTSFNGNFANNAVKLTWSTASEKNNDYFTIERSTNGHEFTQIGQVKGNGNSQVALSYTFLDQQPVAGTTYYRLKQVDFDGAYEYSKMITVKAAPSIQKMQRVNVTAVYPNPVIPSRPVVLDVELASAGEVNLVLLDKTGRTLQSKSVQGQAGKQKIELDLLQQSPAGIYFLKVYQGKEVTMHKLVKNN